MKKIHPLSDLDVMPYGPHAREPLRHVPALHLLSLLDSPELKKHPRLKAYIERARRQLNDEAKREIEQKHHLHD